ncbi:MAG: glycosyltransferase family 39 protein [Bacteroidales bacterium]|nr:glycosyltransferase family 39 protein [Bacteroidales bacterium]
MSALNIFNRLKHVTNIKFVIISIVFLPVIFINITKYHLWGDDFALYIMQAKNIIEDRPQIETNFICNEQTPVYSIKTLPIGFPMLLSVIYLFFKTNITAYIYYISLFTFLLSFVLYKFYNFHFNSIIAFCLSCLIIYNPSLIEFKTNILPDIPFTLFFLLSILYYQKLNTEKFNYKKNLILGFLLGFSILLRVIGLVLLLSVLFDLSIKFLFHKNGKENRKNILYNSVIISITALFVYSLFNYFIFPTKTELLVYYYYSTFDFYNLKLIIANSAKYYLNFLQDIFSEYIFIRAFILIAFAIGLFKNIITKIGFLEYVFIIYLLVIFAFPFHYGMRYFLPALPIIFYYVVIGIKTINFTKIEKIFVLSLLTIIMLFVYKNSIYGIIKNQNEVREGPQEIYSQDVFNYIINNTSPNALFVFAKPRALALYTRRKSMIIGETQNLSKIDRKFKEVGVNYFLISTENEDKKLETYLEKNKKDVKIVWQNQKFKLYKKI